MSLAEDIKAKALESGFDLVGITDAAPIDREQFILFTDWLAFGYAGRMNYMRKNIDKRTNPAKLLDDARSVICVGLNYTPPPDRRTRDEGRGMRDEERGMRDERRCILSFLILFQLSLLKEVGLMPIINACVNCKTKFENRESRIENQVYFSSSANGVICRDCEAGFPDRIRLTKDAGNCLNNLKILAESKEKTLNEIEKVLVHHITELLHRPPKMAKHILENQRP